MIEENYYFDPAKNEFENARISHWDKVASNIKKWHKAGKYYHQRLIEIYNNMVYPGSKILEIGCGNGDLLNSIDSDKKIGIDFSPAMVNLAQIKHPKLTIINAHADNFLLNEDFDYIILSDLLNDVWDVQAIFNNIKKYTKPNTRIIINTYNRVWEVPLGLIRKLGLSKPNLEQNWLTVPDISNLLELSGFEVVRTTQEILFPANIPILSKFLNRFVVRLWPFNHFALTNIIIARLKPNIFEIKSQSKVSVIVPARNEEGNIEEIISRTPDMGTSTEIVFVEGHSTDNTLEAINQSITKYPNKNISVFTQLGKGKGDAVRLGFSKASGDVLMILDADLTVPPEDLPKFYDALNNGTGEFINGVRLIYPMEDEAMRFFNLLGNKFFSYAFSWLLGQPIKDTLCGTKVLWKKDYERIAVNRLVFGDFDPFGDFDLIFGAARLNYKIVDLPIHYRARKYGSTNIQRWRHGFLLLKMVAFAARKLKFI